MLRDDYIALLTAKGACEPALFFARKFPPEATAEEMTREYLDSRRDEAWALWALQNIYQEAPELRALFMAKVTGDNRYLLVKLGLVPGLTQEDKETLCRNQS